MIIVADNSALIALATCSALDILTSLYEEVYVPHAVYREVAYPDKPQADTLNAFLKDRVVEIDKNRLIIAVGGLGEGELEAMALYRQVNAQRLLIDDRRARQVAEANGVNCIGTIGLLLLAKRHGHVDKISHFVTQLRNSPLHFSDAILVKALQLANEV